MAHHKRLTHLTIRKPLPRSSASCPVEQKILGTHTERNGRPRLSETILARVPPEGESRDFSEDGCWVRDFFR
jgi:hypothetical protein